MLSECKKMRQMVVHASQPTNIRLGGEDLATDGDILGMRQI